MSGLLIVVSGPSGAGKSSVLARLTAEMPTCRFSVSMTTRVRREHEIDGKHYFFVTESDFEQRREQCEFLEYARVHGHYYGTPRSYVMRELDKGFDIILDIDVQGAAQVRKSHPEAVFIFLAPPSLAELRKRLEKRGTESPTSLELRMQTARQEMEQVGDYQYLVVNRDQELSEAVLKLQSIVVAEKCRVVRCRDFFFDPPQAVTTQ